jgi:death-on-curing protein
MTSWRRPRSHSAARPKASGFGEDGYPSLNEKVAALLHSIVTNDALVDGNKRLGLVAVLLFYGMTATT